MLILCTYARVTKLSHQLHYAEKLCLSIYSHVAWIRLRDNVRIFENSKISDLLMSSLESIRNPWNVSVGLEVKIWRIEAGI